MSGIKEQRPRPFDRVELAKSSQSTCRICQTKIQKGAMRVAIHTLNKGIYWNCYYYHKECMKSSKGKRLLKKAQFDTSHLGLSAKKGNSVSQVEQMEIEVATVQKKKRVSENTLNARSDLRETLRRVRLKVASHLRRPPYKIFHDSTLDSLVVNLPCNTAELMKINGFGPKNSHSLGPFFLPVIQSYERKLSRNRNISTTQAQTPSLTSCVTKSEDSEEQEDDEIIFESTVSLDETIQKKIKEAEEKGELLELEV